LHLARYREVLRRQGLRSGQSQEVPGKPSHQVPQKRLSPHADCIRSHPMSNPDTLEPIRLAPVPAPASRARAWLAAQARALAVQVLPPLILIGLLVLIWELLGARPGATLPPPSRV